MLAALLALTLLVPAPAHAAGSVSGTVRGVGSAPLGDVLVEACLWDADTEECADYVDAETDSAGHYTFAGLADGDYVFAFYADGYLDQWYDGVATPDEASVVTVAGGTFTGIDATLTPVASGDGSIGGTVTGAGGTGLVGVTVEVCEVGPSGCGLAGEDVSDAGGGYDVAGLFAGTYKVRFLPDDGVHAGEWFDDQLSEATATTVVVDDGEAVSGIDAELDADASVSGVVTGANGSPVKNVEVLVCRWHAPSGECADEYDDYTDNAGAYSVQGLPAGQYRVSFYPRDGIHAPQWYADAPTGAAADSVSVGPGADVTDIDVRLRLGGVIAGTVRRANGTPAAGMSVEPCLWNVRSGACDQVFVATTKADGTYQVRGLIPGDYKVFFWGSELRGGHRDEYYDDRPDTDVAGATVLLVGEGQTVSGVDARMGTTAAPNDPGATPHLVNAEPPTVSGEPRVGTTLTASPGSWTPAPTSFTYAWLADGQPIAGADGASLPITADLEGAALRVVVTASRAGYTSSGAPSAETLPVVPADAPAIENTSAPTIRVQGGVNGGPVPMYRSVLLAQPGTWTPQPELFEYTWLADGTAIPGETGPRLEIGTDLVGARISVTVRALREGYVSAALTTSPTAAVRTRPFSVTRKPTVKGAARVGSVAGVSPGRTAPRATRITYRWVAGGRPVRGATTSKLKLGRKLAGTKLTVQITYTAPGYLTRLTVKVGKVKPARS